MADTHTVQLPLEVIETIVTHVSHIPTLHSLLTVHPVTLLPAARRIYYCPFKVILKYRRHNHDRSRTRQRLTQLCQLLLSFSPQQDAWTRAILRFPTNDKESALSASSSPTTPERGSRVLDIDYCSMIQSFVIQHAMPVDYISEHMNEVHYNNLRFLGHTPIQYLAGPYPSHLMVLKSTTWAIVGHRLQHLRKLQIPFIDLQRYLGHVQDLTSLNSIVFSTEYADYERLSQDFRSILEFVRELVRLKEIHEQQEPCVLHQSPFTTSTASNNSSNDSNSSNSSNIPAKKNKAHRLDVSFYHPERWGITVDTERATRVELFTILPPLYRPKVLLQDNWLRFLTKAEEVELDGVRHIFAPRHPGAISYYHYWYYCQPEGAPSWRDLQDRWPNTFSPNPLAKVLQKCQSLLSLVSFVDNHDIFQWAIDEKKSTFELPSQPSIPPPNPALKRAPLARLELTCTKDVRFQLLGDAMEAFGDTLVSVTFNWEASVIQWKTADLPFSIPGQTSSGSPWHLPRLESLSVDCYTIFWIHSNLLNACPRLRTLYLKGATSGLSEDVILEHEQENIQAPWSALSNLQDLHLDGYPSILFNPETLRSTPNLESLTLYGWSLQRIMSATPANPDPGAQRWLWDWTLPHLKKISLRGMFASRFNFQKALQHLPMLETAYLERGRHKGRLLSNLDGGDDAATDKPLGGQRLPLHHRLKSLLLHGEWSVPDADLKRLLTDVTPKLVHLSLLYCKSYTVQNLVHLTARHGTHLKHCQSSRSLLYAEMCRLQLEPHFEDDGHRLCHVARGHVRPPLVLSEEDKVYRNKRINDKARARAEAKADMVRLRYWQAEDERDDYDPNLLDNDASDSDDDDIADQNFQGSIATAQANLLLHYCVYDFCGRTYCTVHNL